MLVFLARAAGRISSHSRKFSDVPASAMLAIQQAVPLTYELAKERGTDNILSKKRVALFESGTAEIPGSTKAPVYGVETEYPFNDPALRNKYNLFGSNEVRMGMLLEDFDIIAADVANRFICSGNNHGDVKRTLVTACVDRLKVQVPRFLDISGNLWLRATLTWSGKSSMEVSLEMRTGESRGNLKSVGNAWFVFVALDAATMKPTQVPRLIPNTPEGELRFAQGIEHRQHRLQAVSRDQQFPSAAEGQEIHDLYLRCLGGDPTLPPFVWARDTVTRSSHIMHSQDRNMNNHMFGGFLMRLGLETAYVAARRFLRMCVAKQSTSQVPYPPLEHPHFVSMEDVQFIVPVEVGSVLLFSASVMYVDATTNRAWIEVKAIVDRPDLSQKQTVTTSLCFCFECPGIGGVTVVPHSYDQVLQFLRAKRLANEENV
eukprot:c11551_g1_i4.p1 GENE.c11551_g1_i4~~c11551_g1_i4.p1  ORF type:complete len:430 (-),score=67.18 c11551_g1_i4:769-2058(-)